MKHLLKRSIQLATFAFMTLLFSDLSIAQMEKRETALYRQQMFVNSKPTINEKAPELELKTLAGDDVKLSDYFGKTLVVIKGSYT